MSEPIVIPDAVQAVFAEYDDPTHASTQDFNAQFAPILAAVSLIQKQMIEHRAMLDAAELSGSSPLLYTKYALLRQTLGAWEREAAATAEHIRNAVAYAAQFDRQMADAKVDVVNILTIARDAAVAVAVDEPPVAAVPVTP